MDVIPVAAEIRTCICGQDVNVLWMDGRVYTLDKAVHGLTERYDRTGRVTHYDHLGVYPAHRCP